MDRIIHELNTYNTIRLREKEGKGQSRIITGYAILFNTSSAPLWTEGDKKVYEQIAPEAITKELLDTQDIKMTMFHDRQLILARSNKGQGTLSYNVDSKGVSFEFEAPKTVDGDKAIELVKRGDLQGCSFAFSTSYNDGAYVELVTTDKEIIYKVRKIIDVYDFTLAADPAYPDTNVNLREALKNLQKEEEHKKRELEKVSLTVKEMRKKAHQSII